MKVERDQQGVMPYPPVAVAAALAVLLASIEVFIDWVTHIELNVSIIYGLPLVLAAAGRSRWLLWGLARMFWPRWLGLPTSRSELGVER